MKNDKDVQDKIIRAEIVYDPQHEKYIHDWILRQRFLNKGKDKSSKSKGTGKGYGLKK